LKTPKSKETSSHTTKNADRTLFQSKKAEKQAKYFLKRKKAIAESRGENNVQPRNERKLLNK